MAGAAEYVGVAGGTLISVLSNGVYDRAVPVADFQMHATPVTNAEFAAFVAAHPEWRRDRVARVFADRSYLQTWQAATRDNRSSAAASVDTAMATRPVTQVSWFAASAFCESQGARLPTWYEWEYVAASDEARADAREDPAWRARILSWYSRPASIPAQVGSGTANFFGVRDMHGLIWEWVDDFNALLIAPDSRSQNDPDQQQFCGSGAISLQDRNNYAVLMRVALLSSLGAADTTSSLGFRCARASHKELP